MFSRQPKSPAKTASAAAHANSTTPARITIEQVVDQWLGRRPAAPPAPAPVASPAPLAPPLSSYKELEPPKPKPEKKESRPVGFVCEDDVRAAVVANSKIVVGKKTIITPSARDLGDASDVFVIAES